MAPVIWLASYPRSGNTFLRTILFQCFGIRSASVYPTDLGDSTELQQAVGHIEHRAGRVVFEGEPPYFLKTHQLQARGDRRTIYVVRNGADAVRSLFDYHRGEIPLDQIIRGWRFGTWSRHLETWIPTPEPDTLVLRYEDMRRDLRPVVDVLSAFIGRAPVTRTLPERSRLADGKWIRVAADKQPFTAEERALFDEINGPTMAAYGYSH